MIPNIDGPSFHMLVELFPIACEQRSRGLLKPRCISRHGGQEPIGGILRLSPAISALIYYAGMLHQFAQRDGSPAGLAGEPIPMPRQQGDFTAYDAQFRTARVPCLVFLGLG